MAADAHISNQEYVNISGTPLWLLNADAHISNQEYVNISGTLL